jgi:glycosyltransferase involved in cell wall biosynthesis
MSIKLTVIVLTFNHERFISKALTSILNQKVDFDFQILVADDGSTDNTVNLIQQFANEIPGKIILFQKQNNKGIKNNIFSLISAIQGLYIANLDGDDYWSDPLKLQKQIKFLDLHPEYNGVFHDAKIVHIDDAEKILFQSRKLYSQEYVFNEEIFPTDVISRKFILPSSSAVLRSSIVKLVDLRLITDDFSLLWKITCFGIKRAKFYFMNEVMSVYQNHSLGISKRNEDQFHLSHINFLSKLKNDDFYKDFKYAIYCSISNEFKILLDSKKTTLNKRKLFIKYSLNEIKRIWFYRKEIF